MSNTEKLIKEIPKIELHCHIEGTLEPELMFELAQRNNITLPYATPEEIRQAYEFTNLQSFLDIYHQGTSVLITEQDFYDLTFAYLERVKEDNVIHTEIFFCPQIHTARGVSFDTIINGIHHALKAGEEELEMTSELILCFMRDKSEKEAFEMLEHAMLHKDKIIGMGLESAEVNNPPEKFQRVFQAADDAGFTNVMHAGEEGPADYIWQALNLCHAKRIEHGVHCSDDPNLMTYLKDNRIPLTVCPLSNVKLRVFNTLPEHNVKQLLDQGLCVTINSDDPAYFGGYIQDNFMACYRTLNLTSEDVIQLVKNSVEASFLGERQKATYLKLIDTTIKKCVAIDATLSF